MSLMSANSKRGKLYVDVLDGDARDVALKYSEALRTYRHALDKHRYTLSRFGTDSTMYSITERQLNEARDRFMAMAENYIRHAELLREMLGGGLDE